MNDDAHERRAIGPTGGFHGTLVDLVDLVPEHAPALAAATAEDPSLYEFSSAPIDAAAAERYIERARADRRACPYAIVRRADGMVIGSTRLCDAEWWSDDPRPSACGIGYSWLSATARRTGCNREAKRLLLRHAFETWEVVRVRIYTDARNHDSRRAVERLGFHLDGVLRAERLGHRGEVRDSAYYSMLRTEWESSRNR